MASAFPSQSYEFHCKAIGELCRICGFIATSNNIYKVADNLQELKQLFCIDFKRDVEGVHPQNVCLKCYAIVTMGTKRGGETDVIPMIWEPHTEFDCVTCNMRATKSKGGRPKKKKKGMGGGRLKNVMTVDDILNLHPKRKLPASVELAASRVFTIKMKQSEMPNNTIQLPTGGPHPLTLTPVVVARKESQTITKRSIRSRTKQSKEIMSVIAGSSPEAATTQTSHILNSFNADSRETIIKNLDKLIQISAEQMSAMKSCLSLPWNLVREVRRWLHSFNVDVASESSMRKVVGDWVGPGLRTEEIPATVKKNKCISVVLKPWVYIYNLVAFVLNYLDELEQNGLICDGHIPETEIHLKIGGDHGGGSFKMSFQIANVQNPNKPENTVVFSVMEAKDYKCNLKLCLERFCRQIDQFEKVQWKGRKIVVFFFGDYDFLSTMYGLSGAAGKHPCLWCTCCSDAIQIPPKMRSSTSKERTLATLQSDLVCFREELGSDLKKAKQANNVIDDPFFHVPISHVCIPGLHLTLGIYVKMFSMLENFTRELDGMVGAFLAGNDRDVDGDEFGIYVESCRNVLIIETEILELEENADILRNEMEWSAMIGSRVIEVDENATHLDELVAMIEEKKANLSAIMEENPASVGGPCHSSLDLTLKSMGIEHQSYHGTCFIGNHCHTLLKETNIKKLCGSISEVVLAQVGEGPIYVDSIAKCYLFQSLFRLYAKCHVVFNSAQMVR